MDFVVEAKQQTVTEILGLERDSTDRSRPLVIFLDRDTTSLSAYAHRCALNNGGREEHTLHRQSSLLSRMENHKLLCAAKHERSGIPIGLLIMARVSSYALIWGSHSRTCKFGWSNSPLPDAKRL